MEEAQKLDAKKPKTQQRSLLKKVDSETARLLTQLKEKANKKPFGRKIRESEILRVAVGLVEMPHLKDLQEATYSEQDRLKLAHEDYQKAHGKVSLNDFIGQLLKKHSSQAPQ